MKTFFNIVQYAFSRSNIHVTASRYLLQSVILALL